jgi:GTP-binding protein HflX
LRKEKNSFAFSARTGFGIEGLVRAIEKSLPHPNVEISALIPYDRGDLVSAIHERGEILSEEYVETGTQMRALVDGGLAKAIEDALL